MAKSTQSSEAITISAPNFQIVTFHCRGTAPLVMHRFSKKGELMEKMKEGGVARSRKKREPRDFDKDYHDAMHISEEGWIGIPAPAFRSAMISACRAAGYVMTRAKLAALVLADGIDVADGTPLVRITKGEPEQHTTYARNETGVVDIRCRPMWRQWECHLRVRFDADMLSARDIANLVMRAGLQVGVLEGRPDSKKSNGQGWGTFEIVTEEMTA